MLETRKVDNHTRESTHADILGLDLGLDDPLTGPVLVEGAEPGDVLVVELVRTRPPTSE